MSKHQRIEGEAARLRDVTGVPVKGGWNDNEHGYTRYDFNEPLSNSEIDAISRTFGSRFFSFANDSAYIRIDK